MTTIDSLMQTTSALMGLLATALLLPYLDRLNMLRWRQHLWRVVGMHLAIALWLGSMAFDGLFGGSVAMYGLFDGRLDWYHVLGLVGAWQWLLVSRATWRDGPPEYTQSGPVPLDEAQHPRASP